LRHDVDVSLVYAVEMAHLEQEFGIASGGGSRGIRSTNDRVATGSPQAQLRRLDARPALKQEHVEENQEMSHVGLVS